MDEKLSKHSKLPETDAKSGQKPTIQSRPGGDRVGDAQLNPLEGLMLRKEVRIGMAVLAVLVLILGYLFVSKISEPDGNAGSVADAVETEPNETDRDGSSNPPPTVVTSSTSDNVPAASPSEVVGHRGSVYAGDAARHVLAPPNSSYLPRRAPTDESNEPEVASSGVPDAADAGNSAHAHVGSEEVVSDGSNYGRYLQDEPRRVDEPADAHIVADVTHTAEANATVNDADGGYRDDVRPSVEASAVEVPSGVDRPVEPAPIREQPVESIADARPQPSVAATTDAPRIALVETPRNRTYLTVEGDTPASIAQALYDDARFAAALMAYNGVEIAADVALTPGGEVLVPQRAVLEQEFARFIPAIAPRRESDLVADARPNSEANAGAIPKSNIDENQTPSTPPASTRIYQVARGETVYDIARRELGRVSRWREILQLNQDQLGGDIDAVAPGMKLVLPEEGRSSIARQRGELLWR